MNKGKSYLPLDLKQTQRHYVKLLIAIKKPQERSEAFIKLYMNVGEEKVKIYITNLILL